MYRTFLFCSLLLISSVASSTIYKWVDHDGVVNYGQVKPQRQSITPDQVVIKAQKRISSQKAPESIIDSANAIAGSNAERTAANKEKDAANIERSRLQKNCISSKQNLANLNYSSNRLHKDSKGNYTRLTAAGKERRRKELVALIKENCR